MDHQVLDVALDASEHPAAITQTIDTLGRGRRIQMGVASPAASAALRPHEIFAKELTIIGSNSLAETYAKSAERMVDLQSEVSA